MDFSRQPLQGSDIAAFVFAVLALLFFALWRRDRERGMGWLAVAYVVLATQYAANSATLPVDELANPLATALISIGIASFNCGMCKCHQVPRLSARQQRRGASAGGHECARDHCSALTHEFTEARKAVTLQAAD